VTAQTALQVLAAVLGFAASVLFALGSIRLEAQQIHKLASMRWDFHSDVARYLSEQRADYLAGAVLLILSFLAGIVSIAPFQFNQVVLPGTPEGTFLGAAILGVAVWAVGIAIRRRSARLMFSRAEALAKEVRERDEQQAKERKGAL
jgi:hypothetical protein